MQKRFAAQIDLDFERRRSDKSLESRAFHPCLREVALMVVVYFFLHSLRIYHR